MVAHSGEASIRRTHAVQGSADEREPHPTSNPLVVLFVMGIVLVAMWFGLSGALEGLENSPDGEIACVKPADEPGC